MVGQVKCCDSRIDSSQYLLDGGGLLAFLTFLLPVSVLNASIRTGGILIRSGRFAAVSDDCVTVAEDISESAYFVSLMSKLRLFLRNLASTASCKREKKDIIALLINGKALPPAIRDIIQENENTRTLAEKNHI